MTGKSPRSQRRDRGFGLRPGGGHDDGGARPGRQHHQAHDRGAADGLAAASDQNLGVELLDHLDEFRGRPRMQAAFVDDGNFSGYGAR